MFSTLPLPFNRYFQMKVCIQKCRREKHIDIYNLLHTHLIHAYKRDHFPLSPCPSSMQRKCYFLLAVLSVQKHLSWFVWVDGDEERLVAKREFGFVLLIFKVVAWLTRIPLQRAFYKSFPSGKLRNSLCVCVGGRVLGVAKCWKESHLYFHSAFDLLLNTSKRHLDRNQTQLGTSVLTAFSWHLEKWFFLLILGTRGSPKEKATTPLYF